MTKPNGWTGEVGERKCMGVVAWEITKNDGSTFIVQCDKSAELTCKTYE